MEKYQSIFAASKLTHQAWQASGLKWYEETWQANKSSGKHMCEYIMCGREEYVSLWICEAVGRRHEGEEKSVKCTL